MSPGLSDAEVVIIGAGPAGTAAGITLARAGREVVVIDKARFPRDKCCGDGLTSGALRMLEALGVEPQRIASFKPVTDVWLSGPGRRERHFPLPRSNGTFAATATRVDLDEELVRVARESGVRVVEETAFEDIELGDDGVVVDTSRGAVNARWCIAADGMWSPTRKAVSGRDPDYRGDWHAFRQYFSNVGPRAAEDLFVWFEPDTIPGYVWCFPLPGRRANVGFGVLRDTHRTGEMNELWPSVLDRPHIREVLGADAVPEAPHKAWPIPARVGERQLTAHRTLFVGDAAAACDPMTGEGIGQALETGCAAASAIISAEPATSPTVEAHYERAVRRHLALDMRFAGWLGGLLRTRPGVDASLAVAGMTGWTSRNFARWLFEDYPRAVLGTPDRWSRDLFKRPGSWAEGIGSAASDRHTTRTAATSANP